MILFLKHHLFCCAKNKIKHTLTEVYHSLKLDQKKISKKKDKEHKIKENTDLHEQCAHVSTTSYILLFEL